MSKRHDTKSKGKRSTSKAKQDKHKGKQKEKPGKGIIRETLLNHLPQILDISLKIWDFLSIQ